jgi:hypothetical protein
MLPVVVAGLLFASCGNGNGSGASATTTTEAATRTTEAATTTTSTTQPPGTDPGAVRSYIVELLTHHDESRDRLAANPGPASDPDHPFVQDYRSTWETGAAFPQETLDYFAQLASAGERIVSTSDRPAVTDELVGEVYAVSNDEVSFRTCTKASFQRVSAEGDVIEVINNVESGMGVAVRVDGEWKLRKFAEEVGGNDACNAE